MDRPLLAQLAGHDAATLIAAARSIPRGAVDGIDLNCGCPEHIAKKGRYGAFLLSEPDLVVSLVRDMVKGLADIGLPVTVKIRIMENGHHIPPERRGVEGTVHFCRRLEEAGAQMICVHGDRHSKGPKTRAADWDAIRRIKQALCIPVIANGGIGDPEDVQRCLDATGVDAVMSAEALLCNPALFSCAGFGDVDVAASPISATRLALEYLDLVELYPDGDFLKIVKPH